MRQPRREIANTINANAPRIVPAITAPTPMDDIDMASEGLIPEGDDASGMIRILS